MKEWNKNSYIRNLQITCFKMIYGMFMCNEFDNFLIADLNFDNFAKIGHKITKSNCILILEIVRTFR